MLPSSRANWIQAAVGLVGLFIAWQALKLQKAAMLAGPAVATAPLGATPAVLTAPSTQASNAAAAAAAQSQIGNQTLGAAVGNAVAAGA